MDTLSEDQKEIVKARIPPYIESMRQLKSSCLGGASRLVCPPYAVLNRTPHKECHWALQRAKSDVYPFCHMDAHQGNIFVDPGTLDITCFIDFEFAGFYPARFDRPRYEHDLCREPQMDHEVKEFIQFLHRERSVHVVHRVYRADRSTAKIRCVMKPDSGWKPTQVVLPAMFDARYI